MKNYREIQIEKRRAKGQSDEEIIASFGGTVNEYEHVALIIFCESKLEFEMKFTGLFGRTDCKKFLEDYFNIEL